MRLTRSTLALAALCLAAAAPPATAAQSDPVVREVTATPPDQPQLMTLRAYALDVPEMVQVTTQSTAADVVQVVNAHTLTAVVVETPFVEMRWRGRGRAPADPSATALLTIRQARHLSYAGAERRTSERRLL